MQAPFTIAMNQEYDADEKFETILQKNEVKQTARLKAANY
jgi:hypothetical protein